MIILIDNYDSFTYNIYQMLGALGVQLKVFRNDVVRVDEVLAHNPTGIVISPGPGRPEDAGITLSLIKACLHTHPILGICLGHQALAYAFGGSVVQATDVVHGKSATLFHTRQKLFEGVSLPFVAGRYHSLLVEKESLPLELSIDAESSDGEIMAISHDTLPLFGLQFHPESILTPEGELLLKNFIKVCGDAS